MNILILSVGTRNKIVQYFKKELDGIGKVIATDASNLAPALYEADIQYIVPKITSPDYLDVILGICRKHDVKGVLSLIDPELSLLAKNKEKFEEIGVTPIISNYDLVETSFNKYEFFKLLTENNIKTIRTYNSIDTFNIDHKNKVLDFPVFVKPKNGSASININKVYNFEQLNQLFNKHDDLIIQEYMSGKEYGADVYIDLLTGEVVSIFLKEKILMRAGETDKSKSVKIDSVFAQINEMIKLLPFRGIIDIDIFEKNGDFYISEVNPRFGGGYPHGYECGVNIPKMIINNLNNITNQKQIGNYEENIYMMKYNEVIIMKG